MAIGFTVYLKPCLNMKIPSFISLFYSTITKALVPKGGFFSEDVMMYAISQTCHVHTKSLSFNFILEFDRLPLFIEMRWWVYFLFKPLVKLNSWPRSTYLAAYLVQFILDMGLACLGSMAILDLYIYFM